MKRISLVITVCTVCCLFSDLAHAEIAHPEDGTIVGGVFNGIACFNNDGAVASSDECDDSGVDEGNINIASLFQSWNANPPSGINLCGYAEVDPVSSATCPFSIGLFYACSANGYILIQTTKSGHFWAIKGSADCTSIASPEAAGIVPCLVTDSFDPVTGCSTLNPTPNPPEITVYKGYIKLDTSNGGPPPAEHCADSKHDGRMVVDSWNDLIYICTESGWIAK